MKSKSIVIIIAAVIVVGAAMTAGGCRRSDRGSVNNKGGDPVQATGAEDEKNVPLSIDANDAHGIDFPEKQEIRRKFELKPETMVSIFNINGSVTAESVEGDEAELLIVRSVKKREDFQFRQVKIEQKVEGLFIRVENDRKSLFSALGAFPEARQRVHLKLPKKVDLEINGVSGNVKVGEILARVELRGINGSLDVARVSGETDVSGVNGNIDISFAPLKGVGIEIRDVNGNIDLKFEGDVNAELSTWSVNGNVAVDLPGVENKDTEPKRGRVRARIGSGGTPIEISRANGNVTLSKAQPPSATEAKARAK